MKLAYLGALSTGAVILLGIILVVPAYTDRRESAIVIISFNIVDDYSNPNWCSDLSLLLKNQNVKATVFMTGKVAQNFPECVSELSGNELIDFGSQTQNHVNLSAITDYTAALEEVQNGKKSLDEAANVDSKLFRAPFGSTDENIYSLLSRSGIIADFSYDDHYNKFEETQFIRYPLNKVVRPTPTPDFFNAALESDLPTLVEFDSSDSIVDIGMFLSSAQSYSSNKQLRIESTSFLVGMDVSPQKETISE